MHCYRMLGSFQDAEDAVQETFLRAWRRRETFEGRSTFRAWLYRIATNACLDLLAQRRPAPATGGEVPWLQPYPDSLLDELPADEADDPEVVALARETIELAYVVAVQHLAPRPRAVLILRDVLGWPAKDVADLLGDSVNSVNSALQRARAGMREHLPAERQDWTGGDDDATTRELVRRFADASVAADVDALATMLRDDVRCSMPPTPGLHRRPRRRDGGLGRRRLPGDAGPALDAHLGEPAARLWLLPLAGATGAYVPLTIDVLRISGGADHGDHDLRPRPVPAARPPRAPARRRVRPMRRLLATGVVATIAAMVAAGVVAAHRLALGVDFEVDGGESIPVSGIVFQAASSRSWVSPSRRRCCAGAPDLTTASWRRPWR